MAGGGKGDAGPGRVRRQVAVDRGAEAVVVGGQQRGVHGGEDLAGFRLEKGDRACRVAGQRGDGGGGRAVAAYIADHEAPCPVTKREDVVKIAAYLEVTGGRVEGGCHLHARYGRQCAGQEAGLQLAELLGAGTGVA